MFKLSNGTITGEEMIELRNIQSASGFSSANKAQGGRIGYKEGTKKIKSWPKGLQNLKYLMSELIAGKGTDWRTGSEWYDKLSDEKIRDICKHLSDKGEKYILNTSAQAGLIVGSDYKPLMGSQYAFIQAQLPLKENRAFPDAKKFLQKIRGELDYINGVNAFLNSIQGNSTFCGERGYDREVTWSELKSGHSK